MLLQLLSNNVTIYAVFNGYSEIKYILPSVCNEKIDEKFMKLFGMNLIFAEEKT